MTNRIQETPSIVWAGGDVLTRDVTTRTYWHITPTVVRTIEMEGVYFIHSFSDYFLASEIFNECRKVVKGGPWSSLLEKRVLSFMYLKFKHDMLFASEYLFWLWNVKCFWRLTKHGEAVLSGILHKYSWLLKQLLNKDCGNSKGFKAALNHAHLLDTRWATDTGLLRSIKCTNTPWVEYDCEIFNTLK